MLPKDATSTCDFIIRMFLPSSGFHFSFKQKVLNSNFLQNQKCIFANRWFILFKIGPYTYKFVIVLGQYNLVFVSAQKN